MASLLASLYKSRNIDKEYIKCKSQISKLKDFLAKKLETNQNVLKIVSKQFKNNIKSSRKIYIECRKKIHAHSWKIYDLTSFLEEPRIVRVFAVIWFNGYDFLDPDNNILEIS